MTRRLGACALAAGMLLGLGWLLSDRASNAAPPVKDAGGPAAKQVALKVFMRKKLVSSQHVLEGLALEDFDLIAKGAKELMATSAAAEFTVINDPLYAEHADEFRRIIGKLDRAAKNRSIDAATLAYVDMTLSCVECHKYARDVLVTAR